MSGGVGGEEPQGSPLSRLRASLLIARGVARVRGGQWRTMSAENVLDRDTQSTRPLRVTQNIAPCPKSAAKPEVAFEMVSNISRKMSRYGRDRL